MLGEVSLGSMALERLRLSLNKIIDEKVPKMIALNQHRYIEIVILVK